MIILLSTNYYCIREESTEVKVKWYKKIKRRSIWIMYLYYKGVKNRSYRKNIAYNVLIWVLYALYFDEKKQIFGKDYLYLY